MSQSSQTRKRVFTTAILIAIILGVFVFVAVVINIMENASVKTGPDQAWWKSDGERTVENTIMGTETGDHPLVNIHNSKQFHLAVRGEWFGPGNELFEVILVNDDRGRIVSCYSLGEYADTGFIDLDNCKAGQRGRIRPVKVFGILKNP